MTYNIDSNPAERQWLRTHHKKRSDSDLWKILGRSNTLEKAYKYVTVAEAAALSAKGVKIEESVTRLSQNQ